MFVDASAVVAIMALEPEWEDLMAQVADSSAIFVSAMVVYEASHAIARLSNGGRKPTAEHLRGAREAVNDFLASIGAEMHSIGSEVGSAAIEASMLYGKTIGHPADLNMGDCFAYACAKSLGVPLLYKGNDFSQTDLA